MVATVALARPARPGTNPGAFFLAIPLAAAVIVGLLVMHVLPMHPSEQGMGHDEAGAVVTASEATASIQAVAVPGVHAGDTCVSSPPQAIAVVVPADSPDLTPGTARPPVIPPDPTGGGPDLFSLCVQLR